MVKDQYGIELTEEVVIARQAAEDLEIVIQESDSRDKYFTLMYHGKSDDVDIKLPAGFATFMREALYRIGEGYAGVNIAPIADASRPGPIGAVPTHNLGPEKWRECPCPQCELRRVDMM